MTRIAKLLFLSAGLTAFSLSYAGNDDAPDVTHVVELFTSQGCSSCPPANRLVTKVAEEEGVLALSYGVTYWDYLGWKDTFGDPKFTDRQRDYQQALDGANLYTPQIVLNGAAHSPRYSKKDIRTMPLPETNYTASITLENGYFVIQSDQPAGGTLAFITYTPGYQEVAVKRGENRGRTLKLSNVVTDIVKVNWAGGEMKLSQTPQAGQAYAALFHDPQTARIVTAATYNPSSQ